MVTRGHATLDIHILLNFSPSTNHSAVTVGTPSARQWKVTLSPTVTFVSCVTLVNTGLAETNQIRVWWHHEMEMRPRYWPSVRGIQQPQLGFPPKGPVKLSFDVLFSQQCFEQIPEVTVIWHAVMLLWCHYNVVEMDIYWAISVYTQGPNSYQRSLIFLFQRLWGHFSTSFVKMYSVVLKGSKANVHNVFLSWYSITSVV